MDDREPRGGLRRGRPVTGATTTAPVLDVRDAALRYGARELWSGLDLRLDPGELVAVLGSNGAGKTSLVRCLLGLQPLSAGTVRIDGRPARRGRSDVGYVPQQRRVDPMVPLRAKDVVGQGLDGHRWGWRPGGRARRAQVLAALEEVGAASYADAPFGLLSGGSSSGCAWRRPSSATRCCCCATSRCSRSTCAARRPSRGWSSSAAAVPAPRSSSSPTRSTRSSTRSTACST